MSLNQLLSDVEKPWLNIRVNDLSVDGNQTIVGNLTVNGNINGNIPTAPSNYVVSPDVNQGNYTTIQSAIQAAIDSGDVASGFVNIFIKEGTYTENVQMSGNIGLISFYEYPGLVTINGNIDASLIGYGSGTNISFRNLKILGNITNTVPFVATHNIILDNCIIDGTTGINSVQGAVLFTCNECMITTTNAMVLESDGLNSIYTFNRCKITSRFNIGSNANNTVILNNCNITNISASVATFSCTNLGGTITVEFFDTTISDQNSTGRWITGADVVNIYGKDGTILNEPTPFINNIDPTISMNIKRYNPYKITNSGVLEPNMLYVASGIGSYTLPSINKCSIGDTITICGNSGGMVVNCNTGQFIVGGGNTTTSGGSLTSGSNYPSLELMYIGNEIFIVKSLYGSYVYA